MGASKGGTVSMGKTALIQALRPKADQLDALDANLFLRSYGVRGNSPRPRSALRADYNRQRHQYEAELTAEAYRLGLVASGLLAWFLNQLLWWVIKQLAIAIARRWLNGRETNPVALEFSGYGQTPTSFNARGVW